MATENLSPQAEKGNGDKAWNVDPYEVVANQKEVIALLNEKVAYLEEQEKPSGRVMVPPFDVDTIVNGGQRQNNGKCEECSEAFNLLKIAAFELGKLIETINNEGSFITHKEAVSAMSFIICEDVLMWVETAMDKIKNSALESYEPIATESPKFDSKIEQRTIRPS